MPALIDAGRRRADWLVLLLLLMPLYAWLARRSEFLGNLADGAVYLVMADVLSPWSAYESPLGISVFQDFSFPPMYAAALALFGASSQDLPTSYLINAAFGLSMVLATHAWFSCVCVSRWHALVLTLSFASLSTSFFAVMSLHSETLYIALTMLALTLLDKSRSRSAATEMLAAGCIGLSSIVRTVGVSLLAAALLRLILQARALKLRQRVVGAMLLLLPLLLWLLTRYVTQAQSSYLDVYAASAPGAQLEVLLNTIAANLSATPQALGRNFSPLAANIPLWLVLPVLGIGLMGWLLRLRSGALDAWYFPGYLAVVLVWPFPDHLPRFLGVMMPLLMAYCYGGIEGIATRSVTPVVRSKLLMLASLALLVTSAAHSGIIVRAIHAAQSSAHESLVRTPQWYLESNQTRAVKSLTYTQRIFAAMQGIHELPLNACISSVEPAHLALFGQRRSKGIEVAPGDLHALKQHLAECPYVFMAALSQWPPTGYPPMYPYQLIEDDIEVLQVTLWEPNQARGSVLAMLARYRGEVTAPADSSGQAPSPD